MKKSDLKTGMRVRMRDGSIYLVVLNVLIDGRNDILFTNDRGGWMPGESYNDDLTCKSYNEFDIMEVYSIAENQRDFGSNFMTLDKRYSIWKRDELSYPDPVNHPSHYTQGKVECIDAIESATINKKGIEAVCTANVIKYLWRYEDKNGLEDLKKAEFYLNRLIEAYKDK